MVFGKETVVMDNFQWLHVILTNHLLQEVFAENATNLTGAKNGAKTILSFVVGAEKLYQFPERCFAHTVYL